MGRRYVVMHAYVCVPDVIAVNIYRNSMIRGSFHMWTAQKRSGTDTCRTMPTRRLPERGQYGYFDLVFAGDVIWCEPRPSLSRCFQLNNYQSHSSGLRAPDFKSTILKELKTLF